MLLLDNQTAAAYLNNVGRTVSAQCTMTVKRMWMWCLERGMLLSAEYLPGRDNTVANSKSREMKDRSDWRLDNSVFCQI